MNVFRPTYRCTACILRQTASRRVAALQYQPRSSQRRQTNVLPLIRSQRRHHSNNNPRTGNPADDDPEWKSILEQEPTLVRVKDKHSIGIWFLALIPLTAFGLGFWQIERLEQKSTLIARLEDQLTSIPLPLPPLINPSSIREFDHRRVMVTGTFRHDQEILVGPRMRDGEVGYEIITPLQRTDNGHKILVSRGWIPKVMKEQRDRDNSTGEALPRGKVQVLGLLREPIRKNMFTPDNKPGRGEWYFTSINEMAAWVGADQVWVEEIMDPDFFEILRRTGTGIPMGRPAKVQLNNRHVEYIITWFGVAVATSIMWAILYRRKPNQARHSGIVRMSNKW